MRGEGLFYIRARVTIRARAYFRALSRGTFLAAGVLLAAALFTPVASHADDLKGATLRISRDAAAQSGGAMSSASFTEQPSVGAAGQASQTSASFQLRAGFPAIEKQPNRIGDLWASSGTAANSVYLQWTAPGNDGIQNGTHAGSYVIKYSNNAGQSPSLSEANFIAAPALTGVPAPAVAGTLQSMIVSGLTPGVTYYFAIRAGESDGIQGLLSSGATAYASAGGAPTAVAIVGASSSTVTASWLTNGATQYVVDASTASDFTGLLFSSTTAAGTGTQTLAPQGLWANSTYYVRVGAVYGGFATYAGATPSTSTLASPVVNSNAAAGVWLTSMTVNWTPLPASPSSSTAEGYVVDISTKSDFSTLWAASSATTNVALSTLSFTNLDGGNTYYFRVGALNWNSVPSYATAVSTLLPVQLGVVLTTHSISLPGLTAMNQTIAISTSIIVTNTGNVTETYFLSATTTTAGSPWKIALTPSSDQYSMWTVVNSTQAATADYTAGSRLLDSEQPCTAGTFTMGNQSCVQVPAGATRTIWVQVATPKATSTTLAQDIKINARAVKDP